MQRLSTVANNHKIVLQYTDQDILKRDKLLTALGANVVCLPES